MKQKFVPCRSCRNKPGPKPGFYFETVPYGQSTSRVVVECDCHKEWRHKNVFRIRAARYNIWPESLDYDPNKEYEGSQSLENVERFKKYVNQFDEYIDVMVYMYGPNGTQKTTLAQWAGASLLNRGYSVQYMLMQNLLEMLSEMTRDQDAESEKKRLVEKLKEVDLLIIDEAFSTKSVTIYKSGYQIPFLTQFLKDRVEIRRKGSIIISNNPIEGIPKEFGAGVVDLLDRNTRRSRLLFEDNYIKTRSREIDLASLFD